jgi:hypothetical protein
VAGYVAVVDKFFGRKDRPDTEKADLTTMLASVTGSQ